VNVVFTTRELLEMEKEERGWYAEPMVEAGIELLVNNKGLLGN
jgi:hypothetical protein